MIRKGIDGTFHRTEEAHGYLWYAVPQQDELNQPVREVPPATEADPGWLALIKGA